MGKKLTLIGGGSVRTYYFIGSLMKFAREMDIEEVAVMDDDGEKLRYLGGIAKYIVEQAGAPLKVTLTTDPIAAVKDADFVVTTMRVGQDYTRTKDERIALDMGLIGQETTGPGGFSYALRSIPTMLHYMELIRRYSKPGAPVFNFTNPSGLVTQAICDAGYTGAIGICDNASGIKIDLAAALKINASDLTVKVYGLNHLSWASRVELGGVDILPRLMDCDEFIRGFHQFHYFDRDLIRRLRLIPNGYLYYFYHRERALRNILSSGESRGEFIWRNNEAMMEELRKHDMELEPGTCLGIYRDFMHRRESTYMSIELGGHEEVPPVDVEKLGIRELLTGKPVTDVYEGYAGMVFNYIDSMQQDKGLDLAVNVPNQGAIPGMEDGDVVEVTCTVTKDGAVPMRFTKDEIHPGCLAMMKIVKRYEKLTVEAVRTKSRAAAVEALTIHPLVADYGKAKRLADAYLKLNEPWIGTWD